MRAGTLALFAVCPCSRSSSKAASKAALLCNCTPRGVYQLALDEEANRLLVALATDDCLVSVDLDTGGSESVNPARASSSCCALRASHCTVLNLPPCLAQDGPPLWHTRPWSCERQAAWPSVQTGQEEALPPTHSLLNLGLHCSGRVFVSDSKTVQSLHPRTCTVLLVRPLPLPLPLAFFVRLRAYTVRFASPFLGLHRSRARADRIARRGRFLGRLVGLHRRQHDRLRVRPGRGRVRLRAHGRFRQQRGQKVDLTRSVSSAAGNVKGPMCSCTCCPAEHMARLVSLGLFAGEPLVHGLLGIISEYLGQGFVSTIAGSGHPSFADGAAGSSRITPRSVADRALATMLYCDVFD